MAFIDFGKDGAVFGVGVINAFIAGHAGHHSFAVVSTVPVSLAGIYAKNDFGRWVEVEGILDFQALNLCVQFADDFIGGVGAG